MNFLTQNSKSSNVNECESEFECDFSMDPLSPEVANLINNAFMDLPYVMEQTWGLFGFLVLIPPRPS